MAYEKFKNKRLTGGINVTCKYDDGTVRVWSTTKEEVIDHITAIIDDFVGQGYILTLRQLHYQLVAGNLIVNHDKTYKKLGQIVTDCKYAGIIDWNHIEDRGRIPYLPYWVVDVPDALNDTIGQYRLNRQLGQDNELELWTEKDALSGILRRSTKKYHIQLVVNKGYTSSSAIYRAYQRIVRSIQDGRKFTLLYFGDHDPSGLDMIRDIRVRLEEMLKNGRHFGELFQDEIEITDWFEVLPIGLTKKQIRKYKLPPNPTKMSDARSENYIKEHGKVCWEVDALNPKTLTEIVETNITKIIDVKMYKDMLEDEKVDRARLTKIVENLDTIELYIDALDALDDKEEE